MHARPGMHGKDPRVLIRLKACQATHGQCGARSELSGTTHGQAKRPPPTKGPNDGLGPNEDSTNEASDSTVTRVLFDGKRTLGAAGSGCDGRGGRQVEAGEDLVEPLHDAERPEAPRHVLNVL